MALADSDLGAVSSGGDTGAPREWTRAGEWVKFFVALLTLALTCAAVVMGSADQPPRTSFTRVAGDDRVDTAREAAALWPSGESAVVNAAGSFEADLQWRAARCAIDRDVVAPLVWIGSKRVPPSDTAATVRLGPSSPPRACPRPDGLVVPHERRQDWNVYPSDSAMSLVLPSWVPQRRVLHPQVVLVSATDGRTAPDVAVATVLAARLAREGTPTTVLVVPRYLESSRELGSELRREGAEVRQGILLGGPRRVSDGARELVRQLTTPVTTLTGLAKVQALLGPFSELLLAGLALLSLVSAARTGATLLAGKDGSSGSGVRGFLGGLLGGARYEAVVARRREAATRPSDEHYRDGFQDGFDDGYREGSRRRDEPTRPTTSATSTVTPGSETTVQIHLDQQQPAHPDQPTPPHEVVELRVHGVHGTSPASMLGVTDSAVGRVAGDELTGVYRIEKADPPLRTLTQDPEEQPRRPLVSVEAYSWGALTSGVQGFLGWLRRSLWLLLLPFALVNLSYWARTELTRHTLPARLGARAVRAAGLLLTVFFVLTPCLVFIDLGAWQCFRHGVPSCERLPGWTDRLADLSAGQRIAVASLAPMLTLLVLWLLSHSTVTRYEDVAEPDEDLGTTSAAPVTDAPASVLRHPMLWRGSDRTRMLAQRHLAAGVAAVTLFCALHLLLAQKDRVGLVAGAAIGAVVTVSAATLVACLVLVLGPHVDDVDGGQVSEETRVERRTRARSLDRVVVVAALAAYALAWLLLFLPAVGGNLNEDTAWTGRSSWLIAIFVMVTLLHLTLFVGGRMRLRTGMSMVALLGVALLALVVAHAMDLHEPEDVVTVVAAGLLAGAAAGGLAWWHYRRFPRGTSDRSREARAQAWNGAGSSVLLAAGAWTALLFTSTTVVVTADWLNGVDQGVGDLVTTTKVESEDYSPVGGSASTAYAATGVVTLHHARLVRDGDGVLVTDGEVTADRFYRAAGEQRTARGIGRNETRTETELRLPGDTLALTSSCVDEEPVDARCSAEDQAYRGASRIQVAAEGEDGTVRLGPGVVIDPATAPQTPIAVPPVLLWMPVAQVFWLVAVLAVLVGAYVAFRRSARRSIGFPDQALESGVALRDRPACVQARRRAAFGHRAERLLDLVGVTTSIIALPLVTLSLTGGVPWDAPGLSGTRAVADVGMYALGGLSALLVGLGSRMRRSESTRKAVGVLWDLTTFWPRAAHPLAPPCYAERVVPELLQRSRWVLGRHPQNRLVLSGHSQGSLIVVATASRLTDDELGRTRLVTYGSQVRALYGRVFPAVLGPDDVGYAATPGVTRLRHAFPDGPTPPAPPAEPPAGSLRGRLLGAGGSWVNLFRRTDPLGYRVFGDDDGPLGPVWGASADLPVTEVPPDAAGDPGPRVMGHGGYQHTLTYRRVVATWTGEPVVEDVTGTHGVPTHPPG